MRVRNKPAHQLSLIGESTLNDAGDHSNACGERMDLETTPIQTPKIIIPYNGLLASSVGGS